MGDRAKDRRADERANRAVVRRVLQFGKIRGSRVGRQIGVQKNFQLTMLCRVPFSQRFDLLRWRSGGNKTTLGREKSRIAHRRAVGSFHVALRQLREINFIEDRK